ncbi:MAG: hypothetical protein ACKVXR_09885 [Planctomycetota bacterium]
MLPRLPHHFGKNAAIVLGLLAAGFVAAWLRFRAHLGQDGAYTDGAQTYDTSESGAVRYAVWDAPELLGAPLNSPASESRPALSPDGRWLVFVTGERGSNSELWIAEMRQGAPADPRPLAELSTVADECSPSFASDALYFASDRPGGSGGLDLYRARYSDGSFGAAERLAGSVNTSSDECDPAPRPGTSEIVFASNRKAAGFDLYTVDLGASSAPAPLDALASDRDERDPAFTADGRTLFFASDREHGGGDFDLYRSSKSDEGWSTPVPLAGLNTKGSERGPAPAFDDFSLYFARTAGDGAFDLLRARSIELYRLPGRPVGWLELLLLAALLLLALLAWLAKRWPKLETLYKCYLVSLIVHALLLLWFTDLFPGSGTAETGTRNPGFRVRLRPSASAAMSARRERDGRVEGGRASETEDAAPERVQAELRSAAAPAPATMLSAPAPREPEAPAPSTVAAAATADLAAPMPSVALADREAIERRGGEAPSLALEASLDAAARARVEDSAPRREADSERAEGLAANPTGRSLDAPVAPAVSAPGRKAVGVAPEAVPSSSSSVAVLVPREPRATTSSAAKALSLEGLTGGGGERESAFAPERASTRSSDRGSATSAEAPSGPSIAALAPKRSDGPESRPARAPLVSDPGGAPRADVGLDDAESLPKIAASVPGGSGASARGGSSDFLEALGAPATARERDVESAPQKHRGATPAPASAPPPIAMSAPVDRPVDAPPLAKKAWENTPYQNRSGEEKARALELHGGTKETEEAVAKGLAYLARIQHRGGEWGDRNIVDGKYGEIAIGKTGLALLAFLGAGHTHASGTEYSDQARRAIEYLLSMQDEESGHFGNSEAYSHGIATYALAECYALTSDAVLREPLERAVAHILSKQIRSRYVELYGGWSYYYQDETTFDRWPRTSITAWQVMALESARLGGIDVPAEAFEDAATFIENAEDPERGWYRYSHDPERLNSDWPTLPASTPAGLFALSILGRDIKSAKYADLRDFVLTKTPTRYRKGSPDEFVSRGQGNLYFWYYGTLAMFRVGGAPWERWNLGMKETLVRGQADDGSWAPIDIYCKYARDDEEDKSYSTAMCVLSLEVYYRYYLPLLKVR